MRANCRVNEWEKVSDWNCFDYVSGGLVDQSNAPEAEQLRVSVSDIALVKIALIQQSGCRQIVGVFSFDPGTDFSRITEFSDRRTSNASRFSFWFGYLILTSIQSRIPDAKQWQVGPPRFRVGHEMSDHLFRVSPLQNWPFTELN